jgi:hypothetical protein
MRPVEKLPRREFIALTPGDDSEPRDPRVMRGSSFDGKRLASWTITAINADPKHTYLDGWLPTQYATSSPGEAHAETVAFSATGIHVPFSQSNVVGPSTSGALHIDARGYHPARALIDYTNDQLGAQRGADGEMGLRFVRETDRDYPDYAIRFTTTTVDDDPLLGNDYDEQGRVTRAGLAEEARRRRIPRQEDMYQVLTGLTD